MAAYWLAIPESAPPSAGQSVVVAAVAGLFAAALLRLWDAWDQLRAERPATDASLERLDAALARAAAPEDDARWEADPDALVASPRMDFQREQKQLRELKATTGFGAAWRAGFGPGAPSPDQMIEQLDALLSGRESERKQPQPARMPPDPAGAPAASRALNARPEPSANRPSPARRMPATRGA